jgi:hypothetical protein
MKICQEHPNLVKVGQKYRAHDMKTQVGFTVTGDNKSPYKRSVRVKCYQAVRTADKE